MFRKLLTCCCLTLLFSFTTLKAETFRLDWNPPDIDYPDNAGRVIHVDGSFDTDTNILRWILTYEMHAGALPNGFEVALNDGENPKGHNGEMAYFYYDITNMSDPVLTVYAYPGGGGAYFDGSNAPGIQPPDKILSSMNDSFVIEFIAEDLPGNQRRLGFIIDTTVIQNHVPMYPGDIGAGEVWKGAYFTNKIGMWHHAKKGLTTTYNASGYLNEGSPLGWLAQASGWLDTTNQNCHVEDPICEIEYLTQQVTEVDQSVNAKITVTDPQGDDVVFTYDNLPAGATFSVANGAAVPSGTMIDFSWTPGFAQQGQTYDIGVQFQDPYLATADDCDLDLEVLAVKVPVCGFDGELCVNCAASDISGDLADLDGGTHLLNAYAREISRKIKQIRGSNTKREITLRRKARSLHLQAWQVLNEIPAVINTCDANQFCVEVFHTANIVEYQDLSEELHQIVKKLAKRLRRQLRKNNITGKTRKRFLTPVRRAGIQRTVNFDLSNELPTGSTFCPDGIQTITK